MLLVAACSRKPVETNPIPATTTLDKVWLLEAGGTPVSDTTVAFPLAAGRTIVLRHAMPDDAIFLILQFPATKDSLRARDSVHVTIRPMRGKYGFTLATADKLGAGVQATFSYALHFQAPADAATKYPSPGRFEAVLTPALVGADNKIEFLAGARPAADMIRFPVTAAGTFALAAIR